MDGRSNAVSGGGSVETVNFLVGVNGVNAELFYTNADGEIVRITGPFGNSLNPQTIQVLAGTIIVADTGSSNRVWGYPTGATSPTILCGNINERYLMCAATEGAGATDILQ